MAPFARTTLPAKPMGRPSEYRPEYAAMVHEDMAQGFSLAAFAGKIGMARDTVYQWIRRHGDFADAVHRGQTARQRAYEARLLTATRGAQAAAAIFGLKNCAPQDWQEVRNVNHRHAHGLRGMTEEQLRALLDDLPAGPVIEADAQRLNER